VLVWNVTDAFGVCKRRSRRVTGGQAHRLRTVSVAVALQIRNELRFLALIWLTCNQATWKNF
ncbi:MAG: hypothetical protein WA269_10895, partial [Candidatus Udaeobacter sp.]